MIRFHQTDHCCQGYVHSDHAMPAAVLRGSAGSDVWGLVRQVAGGVLRLGRAAFESLLQAHRRRVAIQELEALDDRILKDIGLSRGEISFVVDQQLKSASMLSRNRPG